MRSIPAELASAEPRVVRPRDLNEVYALPSKELRALERQGVLLRLAHGYYAVVPEDRRHLGGWVPAIEAAALGLAQADYGREGAALMGVSAARIHRMVPRALGRAVVASARQRPELETTAGVVQFVARDVARLDVQRVETELADGWVTTIEQTLVDLVDRPALGGLPISDVVEVVEGLAARADRSRVGHVGMVMRKRGALQVLGALWAGGDWRRQVADRC